MLLHRTMTALVLLPLALLAIFKLESSTFSVVLAGVMLLAAWEWSQFVSARIWLRRAYVGVFGLWLWLAQGAPVLMVSVGALLGWVLALWAVISYPRGPSVWGRPGVLALMGVWILWPAWLAMASVRALPEGSWWVLYVLGLVWAADVGAYFVGRAWGVHKLAPEVSPGKSIEGMLGGLLAVSILAMGVAWVREWSLGVGFGFVLASVGVAWVSVLGDLLESMVKRFAGVKDSGSLLPGHGGVLDRIDSLTAALPIFICVFAGMGF